MSSWQSNLKHEKNASYHFEKVLFDCSNVSFGGEKVNAFGLFPILVHVLLRFCFLLGISVRFSVNSTTSDELVTRL